MTMNKKLILAAPCVVMLAACGGSGDGSATNPLQSAPAANPTPSAPAANPTPSAPVGGNSTTLQPVVLQTFNDGAGIARISVQNNGETVIANVMAPNISSYTTDPTGVIDLSGVNYVSSNSYGDLYAGTTTINGTTVDVVYYEDSSGQAAIGYLEGNGTNVALALGYEVSNIPSGSYTYTGTNIIGYRDGSNFEDGTFAMRVNFNTGTASLTGSTNTSAIGGSGISVNTSDGTFSGNNLTLTETTSGFTTTATIHGNFHGAGATGVTGLYSDNGATPIVAGAIAGTR